MVKSLVSMLTVLTLLIVSSILETWFVNKQFKEFDNVLFELYQKVDEQVAVPDDVLAVQRNWLDKKRVLHIFIPHNDIKEVDLWIAESVTLVRDKEWKDAISKIEVLRELSEQIPKTFRVSFENIL